MGERTWKPGQGAWAPGAQAAVQALTESQTVNLKRQGLETAASGQSTRKIHLRYLLPGQFLTKGVEDAMHRFKPSWVVSFPAQRIVSQVCPEPSRVISKYSCFKAFFSRLHAFGVLSSGALQVSLCTFDSVP